MDQISAEAGQTRGQEQDGWTQKARNVPGNMKAAVCGGVCWRTIHGEDEMGGVMSLKPMWAFSQTEQATGDWVSAVRTRLISTPNCILSVF